MLISIDKLLPGDIIFVRRGMYDYIHVGICTKTGGTFDSTKMAHTLGKAEPYALVETHLAPQEVLLKNDLHYDIVRPKSHLNLKIALEIISTWLLHLIPYDSEKYAEMVKNTNNKDIIGSEGSLNNYSPYERKLIISEEICAQNKLFEANKYSLIALAATRNIGPTPPFQITNERRAEGIICTSPIIMCLQISAIASLVDPVHDFWVSDRYVAPEELKLLLDEENSSHSEYFSYIERLKAKDSKPKPYNKFHSALRMLNTSLEKFDFTQISVGLRLDPMLCPVSILYFSILTDDKDFENLGELNVPHLKDANNLRAIFESNIKKSVTDANLIRGRLYNQINYGSAYVAYWDTYLAIKSEILRYKPRF